MVMVAVTWIVPVLVFFVTIFGWQYFVGYRSVKEGMCYVQYMEEALFNCLLQVRLSVTLSTRVRISQYICLHFVSAADCQSNRTWNSLQQHVTSTPSMSVFQGRLKAFLFRPSFP